MMWTQNSFANPDNCSCLYLVPTPIGNLEDMTFRAISILKEVDLIAAEDTRNTRKLLNYFEIEKEVISYYEHNKKARGQQLVELLKEGKKIALVSDAGMPVISDPGYELVKEALDQQINVIPLPGPNAALTALIASGINPQPFYFYGFLNRKRKAKQNELNLLKNISATVILYESPHRLKETLEMLLAIFGDRKIVLCRELTKKYEEFIRASISEALQWAKDVQIRGEFCLIIEGQDESNLEEAENWWKSMTIVEHVNNYINENGVLPNEAIKLVAKDRQLKRREVYDMYHIKKS